MKKEILINAVFATVGTAVGSIIGYFVGRRKGRKTGYYEALSRYEEANKDITDVTSESEADSAVAETLEKAAKKEEQQLGIDFGDVVEVEVEDITSYTKPRSDKRRRPYEITVDEVGNDNYDIKTVLYHRQNSAVCDEFDRQFANVNRLIGWGIFSKIDMDETIEHVWVRNEEEHTDYDIIVQDDAWDDDET